MRIVVCVALTRPDGRVLVQQRPTQGDVGHSDFAGYWEFPGGKVEAGETLVRALVRELAEELAIAVDEEDLTPLSFGTDLGLAGPLVLLLYRCTRWRGEPRALQAAALDWLDPPAMRALRMPPADRPLVEMLVRLAGST